MTLQQQLESQVKDFDSIMREYEKRGLVHITPMGQVRAWCKEGHHEFYSPSVIHYSIEKYGRPICWNHQKTL